MLTLVTLFLALLPAGVGGSPPETIFAPIGGVLPNHAYGWSVAVDGDKAVVGAYGGDGVVPGTGVAYVYQRNAAGVWSQIAVLKAADGQAGDRFGSDVDIDAGRIIVGADHASGVAAGSGAAYVFRHLGLGLWLPEGKLTAPFGEGLDYFASAVSLDGSRAVVGAVRSGPPGAYGSGRAFVFARQGTTWSLEAELEDETSPKAAFFGLDVSLDGDQLAVSGTYQVIASLYGPGTVHIYTRQGTAWTRETKVTSSQASITAGLGGSIGLSGDILVAGATGPGAGVPGVGSAYVFERDGAQWNEMPALQASDGAPADQFGRSVSLFGGTLVVGAPADATRPGAVYVFESLAGGPWLETSKITASNGYVANAFGWATSLAGGTLVVGAPGSGITYPPVSPWAYSYELTPPPVTYCVGKVNSAGCLPTIATSGAPSATDPRPFQVTASNAIEDVVGLFLFGVNGRHALAFQGGTLCARGPLRRTPLGSSGGVQPPPSCSGSLTLDFNAWVRTGNHAVLVPGVQVNGQFFYRDPASPSTTGLSDAVEFVLLP